MSKKDKKKKKKYKKQDNKLPTFPNDVYFHHVCDGGEDDILWSHSHGMEHYGLRNISIYSPDKTWAQFNDDLLRLVCGNMIAGDHFNVHSVQIFDEYEGGPLIHAFILDESEERDDFTGEKNLIIIYPFDGLEEPILWNGKSYIFNNYAKQWIAIEDAVRAYFGEYE